jgi:hypothetical protein
MHVKTVGIAAAVAAVAILAGCSLSPPQMTVRVGDLALAQIVSISSKDTKPFFVEKVVANHNDGNAACVSTTGQEVNVGEVDTITFAGCGQIKYLTVHTDRGDASFTLDATGNVQTPG